MRHAPQDRIVRPEIAGDVVKATKGFEGALAVRVEDRRQGPPKLFFGTGDPSPVCWRTNKEWLAENGPRIMPS